MTIKEQAIKCGFSEGKFDQLYVNSTTVRNILDIWDDHKVQFAPKLLLDTLNQLYYMYWCYDAHMLVNVRMGMKS